jgi:peptide deformylase
MEIVQIGDQVLRDTAKEVHVKDIASKKIKDVLKKMQKALNGEGDGVAIAAPQIGESLRIFIVSGRAFDIENNEFEEGKTPKAKDMVCINPVLTKLSRDKRDMDEGCLSVRWKYGKVKRSEKATVTAYDENGKKFTRGGSGLLAQIFQHETDHLNGTLFIDKATDVVDLPPKDGEPKKMRQHKK